MLLSLTEFPIVHRRQDFSQSTPTNETLGLLTSMTVTFSEPQIKFENLLFSIASSESYPDSFRERFPEPLEFSRVDRFFNSFLQFDTAHDVLMLVFFHRSARY